MDKIYLVNKPQQLTSRDVVNRLGKILNFKKIGHTGTLDPLATGVLVCLTGKYTKLVDLITSANKEYIATIKLGIKTDTGDITGNIIETKDYSITLTAIKKVFANFPSEYNQQVPIYSAKRVNGKHLYEYARNNEEVILPKIKVHIYSLELLEFSKDLIKFKANVSKGTYIRSLIEDICSNLNTVGTMQSLIRTKQGDFTIENSATLEDIEKGLYEGVKAKDILDIPILEIPDEFLKTIVNGGKINNMFKVKDLVLFTRDNKEIAIYKNDSKILKPYVML